MFCWRARWEDRIKLKVEVKLLSLSKNVIWEVNQLLNFNDIVPIQNKEVNETLVNNSM